jgi:fused signal recognition particle receptor
MRKAGSIFLLCFFMHTSVWAENGNNTIWGSIFKLQHYLAEQGDPEAMVSIGDMYRDGEGVEQDTQKALEWYKRAAKAGHKTAQNRIVEQAYRQDQKSRKQQEAKAAQEQEKALQTKLAEKKAMRAIQEEENKKIALEKARKEAQRLAAQLARERAEAEKARKEAQRLKALEEQLAQERAAVEKALQDVENLKGQNEQLEMERKEAEQARIAAEQARLLLEKNKHKRESIAVKEQAPKPQTIEASTQTLPTNQPSVNVNRFKTNPCDGPQSRNNYTCQLLNRRR